MTQVEKLTFTKRLIDKLADGINPLNNCPHEEDYFLNDATIIRCFFHASQVLERVLQNGGVIGSGRRGNLKPFAITEEEKVNVPLSDTPVSITAFVGSINSAVNNPSMRRLTATQVTSWLEQAGFLTTVLNAEGKNQRVPTDNADLIGISQVERKNSSGTPFLMNLYNIEAQRFILDNLDAILAAAQNVQQAS